MLPRGTTKLAAATFGAWIVLLALVGARRAGAALPSAAVVAFAAVALTMALAVACQTLAHAWRGPVVVDFRRDEAVMCGPTEAEVVRAAAQLRGTMGGAGYVSRARLTFPAIAWVAAALIARSATVDPTLGSAPAWPFAMLALSAAAAAVFPARPFYYREGTGGSVLLYPQDAWVRLARFSKDGASARRWPDPRFHAAPSDGRGPVATPQPTETPQPTVEAGRTELGVAQQGSSEP